MDVFKVSKCLLIIVLFIVLPAAAQDNSRSNSAQTEPITYKCFVEYAAGNGHDVRFVIGNYSNAKKAGRQFLRGVVEKGQNKDIRVVHKVHECAVEGDQFKSSQAKRIDNITPR